MRPIRTSTMKRALAALVLVGATVAAINLPTEPAAAAPSVTGGLGFDQYLVFGTAGGVPVQAVTVAFEPTGTGLFAADKTGRIVHYTGPGDGSPQVTLDIRGKVHDALDRGLVGLTLDPDFGTPANRFVYFTYTYDKDPFGNGVVPAWGGATGGDNCGGGQNATFGGCTVTDRLSRIHVSASGIADGAEQVLLENGPDSGFCNEFLSHSIDSVQFGPDGFLYVSAGDGASFSSNDWGQLATRPDGVVNPCNDAPGYRGGASGAMTAPTAEGGVLRAQALRTKYPADGYTPLDGTIMRLNRDGSIPASNPLVNNGIPGDDRVVAFGMRNPFRFTFRPGTNEMWVGHVGNGTWESIDRFTPGATPIPNFGWPCYEGSHTDVSNTTQFNLCTSLGSAPETIGSTPDVAQLKAPWFEYSHDAPANTTEGCKGKAAGSSITGGTFTPNTDQWPLALRGKYLFGDYGRGCIWAVDPDSATPTRTWVASGLSPTNIQTGPDGNVYVVDLGMGGGFLWRLGVGPTARITVAPASLVVPEGGTATFDGATSSLPLNTTATYAWDLNGDGSFEASGVTVTSPPYSARGPVRVGLRVTDSNGHVGRSSVLIQVGIPPTISAFDVSGSGGWSVGDVINYSTSATDFYGSALHYRWDVVVRHCDPSSTSSDCHEHLNIVGALPDAPSGSFGAPDHEWQAYLRVALTVTDDFGLSSTQEAILPAIGVPVTVDTRPSGLRVGVSEVAGTSPLTVTRVRKSQVQLSLPQTQSLNGRTYVFTGWDDAPLAPADRQLVPTDPVSLVANFAPTDGFTALGPVRVLDTRDGTGGQLGKVPGGSTITLSLAAGGVPPGASGAVLNLTSTEAAGAGFVTAYPCDSARPFSSNVNVSAGTNVANLAQVRVSAAGTVCLFASQPTHLVADLAGYFSDGGAPFAPVAPTRVLDTRVGLGARAGIVGPDAAITLDLSASAPPGATAAVLNVTATDVAGAGFVTAYPCGERPMVSNLNVPRSDTRANLAVVPLGPGSTVCLYTQSGASLIADLAGWYGGTGSGAGRVVTQQPRRVMDTRENIGSGPLVSRTPVTLDLAPYAPTGATAVVLNLTSVGPSADGFVTAYPCGELPVVSNLNVPPNDTRPNLVMVQLGPASTVCLYSQSPTNLVVDLAGWAR